MIATQHSGMLICNENAVKGLVNNRIELIGDRTRWLLKHFFDHCKVLLHFSIPLL